MSINYTVIYYKSSRQTVWQCLSIIQSYITKYKSSRQTISPRLSVLQFNTTYKVSRHDIYFPVIYKNLRRKKVVFNSFKDLSSAGLLTTLKTELERNKEMFEMVNLETLIQFFSQVIKWFYLLLSEDRRTTNP
jgi:adenylate cyclase class IV